MKVGAKIGKTVDHRDIRIMDTLCAEYRPVYEAQETQATGLQKFVQNLLAKDLAKTRNFWNRIDILRFYGNHINSGGEACLSWKQPAGGASLMDPGKGTFDSGTESWVVYGSNTIENDAGTLKITYVDNANGAYVYLRESSDMNTNLVIGKTYRVRLNVKINTGSAQFNVAYASKSSNIFSNTNYQWIEIIFVAVNNTVEYLRAGSMAAGEIIWIDEWYIQEWTNATAFNNPTHTPDQGILFNGTNRYLDHNFRLDLQGVNYTQNSASQILYIRTNIASNGGHGTVLNADLKDCDIIPRNADVGNTAFIRTNDGTNISGANTDGSGLYINTRTGAAIKRLWKNAGLLIDGTTASTGVPTHKPYTGAYNDDDTPVGFRGDQVFAEIWSDGMDNDDVIAITAILNDKATRLGVNVF